MKKAFSLISCGLVILGVFVTGRAQSASSARQNRPDLNYDYDTETLQQLSPPQRPGRRGGVFVTGAMTPDVAPSTRGGTQTIPEDLSRLTNSSSLTNGETVISTNQNRAVLTNGTAMKAYDADRAAVSAGIAFPPFLPAPVPPGNTSQSSGSQTAPGSADTTGLPPGPAAPAPGPASLPPVPVAPVPGPVIIPSGRVAPVPAPAAIPSGPVAPVLGPANLPPGPVGLPPGTIGIPPGLTLPPQGVPHSPAPLPPGSGSVPAPPPPLGNPPPTGRSR